MYCQIQPAQHRCSFHAGKGGLVQAGFFPASKRGLQVHNLQRALAALQTSQGYLASLPARLVDELADGHREATLDFLWHLLLHHQVFWVHQFMLSGRKMPVS